MRARLVVVAGPDQGREFPLEEGVTLLVGRGQDTGTKLTDPQASRVHCRVTADGGRFRLADAGGATGTRVNGKSVAEHDLKPGDLIQLGSTQLRLEADVHEQSTMMARPEEAKTPQAPAAQVAELTGKTLSHYEIGPAMAKGRTGMVFRARDAKVDRPVALKVLWPEFTTHDEEVQRFIRAMKTMLPIRHENLVELIGAGKSGPHCWIAMELVEGESLTKVIHRIGTVGMLDWQYALRVAVQVARALEVAHEHHVIHRNVTPENVLIREADGVAKLGDLMLAKATEGMLAKQVTRPGELIGALAYMSPERTRGDVAADTRSDIYGLGATVYALLTGRPPIEGSSLPETIAKIRTAEPTRPKKYQLSIPDLFEGAVMTMLAKRPEDRFQTPTEVLRDLARVAKYSGMTM